MNGSTAGVCPWLRIISQAFLRLEKPSGNAVIKQLERFFDERLLAGKSPKNQTVHAPAPAGVRAEDLAGSTVRVRVDEAKTWYLAGEIVDGPDAADGR